MHPNRCFSQLITVALLALPGVTAFAQERSANRGEVIVPLLHREHVASISFATIANGKTVLAEAYGEAGPGVSREQHNFLQHRLDVETDLSGGNFAAGIRGQALASDEPMWPCRIDPDLAADPRADS